MEYDRFYNRGLYGRAIYHIALSINYSLTFMDEETEEARLATMLEF